eukprot:3434957-Rhodomonas_salina.3
MLGHSRWPAACAAQVYASAPDTAPCESRSQIALAARRHVDQSRICNLQSSFHMTDPRFPQVCDTDMVMRRDLVATRSCCLRNCRRPIGMPRHQIESQPAFRFRIATSRVLPCIWACSIDGISFAAKQWLVREAVVGALTRALSGPRSGYATECPIPYADATHLHAVAQSSSATSGRLGQRTRVA